jgi:outer membrane receptor protein involved in Fe transport
VLLALASTTALAQGTPPTINPVVTTAERTPNTLANSMAAVTRLSAAEVARIPQATFADVLRTVPGFAVVDFDGLGFDPQLITRGFYGGGEAEYVVVLLDGKPLNQVHTGRALWEALPSGTQIEAIEIVRGGNSALYGDAAIGGVINIISRPADPDAARFSTRYEAGAGSYGLRQAGITLAGSRGALTLGATGTAGDGYRAHSERLSGHARGRLTPWRSERGSVTVTALRQTRTVDEPGPLLTDAAATDRRASDVLYRFDEGEDTHNEFGIEGTHQLNLTGRLTWFGTGSWRDISADRTIALAPGFGDTQGRDTDLRRFLGNVQYEVGFGRHYLVAGVEALRGSAKVRYFDVVSGPPAAYVAADGERGALNGGSDADRTALSAYTQFAVYMTRELRLTVGGRFDRFADEMTPRGPDGGSRVDVTNQAFSPKVGINYRYRDGGNVYVTAGQSFKAPTLDQLFDQRALPVPFPPFAIRSSNSELKPATGTNIEAGAYQSVTLTERVAGAISLSVYDMAMRDEIDFNVATLSYGNINQSRHSGAELGLRLTGPRASTAFVSYTLQTATIEGGANDGNQIKAIPENSVSGGVSVAPRRWLETGLTATRTGEAFFDDANTRPIDAWTRVDARVAVQFGGATVTGEIRNLLDAEYVSTGFLDPAGSGGAYVYPAAGRVFMLGVRWGK